MRHGPRLIAIVVVAALASCGHADDVGTFANSCSDGTFMAGDTFACVDLGDGYTPGSCGGSGFTVVATTPCPTANRVGHCIYVSDIADHEVSRLNWYAPASRDAAQRYCDQAGGPGAGRVSTTFFAN